ncbi:T9SS type B sorting domain-containing protein [Chryseobacterium indoltheticum]|uniref:Gliding motility-associated C-terminal domain n=1 Tax=Chryseobacterium indoltheticum TaxID=254 RepID=A0A381JS77_9FLAO|nr:gliding motility-associated C-terminal domain-containing protein [Chryseobacterium indoltheticum]AZA75749.1 gliding motility-associated C-terminal domain-containing protein [Chryseobacterium indoltheticum]SIQ49737.1 gliding motility-associated C-terminal domain-containing protein [Chryseobacterium indoltheticum]SUY53885.1 gliding motility-associated C-terminal domain [Chryseobacterium indoltheticum]
MRKLLLTFLLMIFSINILFAQRDTEHWIAPYFDSSNTTYNHGLYFSTDSTTPFDVTIYSNGTAIGTVNIQKGNPKVFQIPPASSNIIELTNDSDASAVINKGIYTKGDKPYFLTLRIYNGSHGEILTSKGKAGIGTTFYAAAAPITNTTATSYNFTTGIMATEDGTTVTVSGYDANIQFINNLTPPLTTTFTLNKGQSYVLAGEANAPANLTGFIGSKITSNKPISVTNGNSNGFYANGTGTDGSDLILDQSVPTNRLGKEFGMIRTLATLNTGYNMEGGIIIATENNTEIYLNNGATPVATINEGDFYRILDNAYINQGNSHYNVYVRTTKNVYLYQLVAGNQANARNNGGYNYIPPLNCFLPRKIDEIGKISEMPTTATTSGQPTSTFLFKLNIITEAGATVTYTVNGGAPITPTAAQGPFTLTGNTNWVTYAISGISGNVAVQSNKAVTAGANGGYSSAGYGGYFAGFSSIPLIAKQTGECIPGLVLEVDDSYDTYQWFRNDVAIPGANGNIYTPTIAGNYTVRITVGSCLPAITPVFKVFTCLQETAQTKTVCEGYLNIVPQFTTSGQTFSPSSVQIITPPANGTAIINPTTGVIGYTPNNGFVGTDTIVYKFCGNDPEFVDCEQITLTLTVAESPVVNDATLRTCFLEDNIATGLFDLTDATVTTQLGATKKYYPSLTDANNQTNEILTPDNYIAPNGVAYVRVSNANGCYRVAKITLVVLPPVESAVLVDKVICIEDKTVLDAGPGFDGYEWSTGDTTQTISDVGVGTYWVKLKTGDCITKQAVKVYASEQPVITNIEVSTTNITVYVTGGVAPYEYSINNINWQSSNVFTDLPRGDVKVYVRDTFSCVPIEVTITIPNIINVITPNSDGINDVLDYSALANKPNLVLGIFDRYGIKIFEGNKDTGYIWDGTINKTKKVSTGNYWFSITWNETKTKTPIKFSGWILVKNRE